MTAHSHPRFNFPRINRVHLHDFSLYRLKPNASIKLDKGVTCIAGANGIGKSTYLAAVNFALTGLVPDPDRRLLSIPSYLESSEKFTRQFFEGRIHERDRETAAITIEGSINGVEFSISRYIFSESSLSKFAKKTQEADATFKPVEAISDIDRADQFKKWITEKSKLISFEQFIFLQHFVWTFDESRHLLFWDENAASLALHLVIGGDPLKAAKVDELYREMEKEGSRGRNLKYNARNIEKRINALESVISIPSGYEEENAELMASEYEALQDEEKSLLALVEIAEAKVTDAELKVAQMSAKVAAVRAEYSDKFENIFGGGAKLSAHPLIQSMLREHNCPVCKNSGDVLAERVKQKLDAHCCPLCDSSVEEGNSQPDPARMSQLVEIDEQLEISKIDLEEAFKLRSRLLEEAQSARRKYSAALDKVRDFEDQNADITEWLRDRSDRLSGPVASTVASLSEAKKELLQNSRAAYDLQASLKKQLEDLMVSLEAQYARVESIFVPQFRELAELFLGIELDIKSATIGRGTKLQLSIDMRGNKRRQIHQLSESQRFFVDIAFRMALARHVSESESPASLFIDTPEGSLDIAYEKKAGEMFGRFVGDSHSILMTANINSSRLLTTLARRCGKSKMTLVPMMDWTELSEVQQEESGEFENALKDISNALVEGAGV